MCALQFSLSSMITPRNFVYCILFSAVSVSLFACNHMRMRMLIEVFTFGNNCQCFNDLIGISTISAVMMLLSC